MCWRHTKLRAVALLPLVRRNTIVHLTVANEATKEAEHGEAFVVDADDDLFFFCFIGEGNPPLKSLVDVQVNSGPDKLITEISPGIIVNRNKSTNSPTQISSKFFREKVRRNTLKLHPYWDSVDLYRLWIVALLKRNDEDGIISESPRTSFCDMVKITFFRKFKNKLIMPKLCVGNIDDVVRS
jgi:hypothetical protein